MADNYLKSQRDMKDMFILNYKEHIIKADYNYKILHEHFVQDIKDCPGWVCIIAFYSALHYVDAYLLKKHGIRSEHHDVRNRDVSIHLSEIYVEYLALYNYGKAARYDKMKNLPDEGDALCTVDKDLPRIQEIICGYL